MKFNPFTLRYVDQISQKVNNMLRLSNSTLTFILLEGKDYIFSIEYTQHSTASVV
jgi:hypothetical protein